MLLIDRGGPVGDLLFGHVAARLGARVLVAPFVDINQVLLAREQRTLADLAVARRDVELREKTVDEVPDHGGWYERALPRVDEAKQDEMAQKDPPVRPETANETVPVEQAAAVAHDMRDVRAVEALALHDHRLGPDHLFGG